MAGPGAGDCPPPHEAESTAKSATKAQRADEERDTRVRLGMFSSPVAYAARVGSGAHPWSIAAMADASALRRVCGQLVVGGFEGTALTPTFARALAAGERGGAILFARNLTPDPMQCADLARAIAGNSCLDLPPLVSIDQEGGRVARLKTAPILELPPMAAFGRDFRARDPEGRRQAVALAHDAAEALGAQLAALGLTMNFAPVLDVNTRPENPIIGDRAFGDDAAIVSELGLAWALGLRTGGVLACGKHFPGHGDTTKDSHFDLPIVDAARARLDAVELPPVRAASRAGIAAFMTAHVVYSVLDADVPATLSRAICTDLARHDVGFTGWLVSDDLEMKAVADRWPIEDAAVRAIEAGCDALLVCRSEELQERAVAALADRARTDSAFEARVREAHERFMTMRREVAPRPVATRAQLDAASAAARAVEARIAAAHSARVGGTR